MTYTSVGLLLQCFIFARRRNATRRTTTSPTHGQQDIGTGTSVRDDRVWEYWLTVNEGTTRNSKRRLRCDGPNSVRCYVKPMTESEWETVKTSDWERLGYTMHTSTSTTRHLAHDCRPWAAGERCPSLGHKRRWRAVRRLAAIAKTKKTKITGPGECCQRDGSAILSRHSFRNQNATDGANEPLLLLVSNL